MSPRPSADPVAIVVRLNLSLTLDSRPPAFGSPAPVRAWAEELCLPADRPEVTAALVSALDASAAGGRLVASTDEAGERLWCLAPEAELSRAEEP